jgi:hypothetical protein
MLRRSAPNKKPRQGSMIGASCCLGEGLELCRVAEPGELGHQTLGFGFGVCGGRSSRRQGRDATCRIAPCDRWR